MDIITVAIALSIIGFGIAGWLFKSRELFRLAVGYFPMAILYKILTMRGEHITSLDIWIMWVSASVFAFFMSLAIPKRSEKKGVGLP